MGHIFCVYHKEFVALLVTLFTAHQLLFDEFDRFSLNENLVTLQLHSLLKKLRLVTVEQKARIATAKRLVSICVAHHRPVHHLFSELIAAQLFYVVLIFGLLFDYVEFFVASTSLKFIYSLWSLSIGPSHGLSQIIVSTPSLLLPLHSLRNAAFAGARNFVPLIIFLFDFLILVIFLLKIFVWLRNLRL